MEFAPDARIGLDQRRSCGTLGGVGGVLMPGERPAAGLPRACGTDPWPWWRTEHADGRRA
ncbi:hypothetical protein GCM10020218_096490 [Dactylosporangium vinaceum]